MKKRLIATVAALVIVSCTSTISASISHSYSSSGILFLKKYTEKCTVSKVKVGEYGTIGVEVHKSSGSLIDSRVIDYQNILGTSDKSYSASVSTKTSGYGYYAATHYSSTGRMTEGKYGKDT